MLSDLFGYVGIDASMISDLGAEDDGCGVPSCRDEDIIELANGCICCTVADDFLPTMQQLLAQDPPPDHIVIETSGLALPQPLVQAFNWPDIRASVRLDGVITLVDGPAIQAGGFVQDMAALDAQRQADEELDHESPIEELFSDQLEAANLILLSKSDLLDAEAIASVSQTISQSLSHKTPIVPVSAYTASLPALLGLGLEDEAFARSAHSHHHEHGHDAFESRILILPALEDGPAFVRKLSDVAEEFGVLRAKGRLAVTGKMLPLIVQAVGRRVDSYFGKAGPKDRNDGTSALVVIGPSGMNFEGIASALGGSWQSA